MSGHNAWRRILAAILLAAVAGVVGVSAASAAPGIAGPPPVPSGSGGGLPNPLGGIGSAIMDKLCPPRQAPYPQMPEGTVISRGGGPGDYAQYGYAGLRWTTYDAGCLSWEKTDTSIGSQIDTAAVTIDSLVNNLQVTALDPDTTTSFDAVVTTALQGLKAAFWTPWSLLGIAALGLLLAVYATAGREGDFLSLITTAACVLGVITFVLLHPTTPRELSNGVTTQVASKVSETLIMATPNGPLPKDAPPAAKYGEAYQQIARKAWLEGSFCDDPDAIRRYATRLRDAQAFSVTDLVDTQGDSGAQTKLVKAKRKEWLAIGSELAKTNPAAFGCWKGEGTSRVQAGVRHLIVSVFAGFWVALFSIGELAVRYMLGIVLLFGITFGALMLFSRRMTDHMSEWALLALLGPAFMSAGVGTLLWGYYAIMLTPDQAWWMSAVAASALGIGLFMSRGFLMKMLLGMAVASRAGGGSRRHAERHARRAGRKFMSYSRGDTGSSSGGGGATAAAAAGAAAGAAAAGLIINHDARSDHDDDGDGFTMPEAAGDGELHHDGDATVHEGGDQLGRHRAATEAAWAGDDTDGGDYDPGEDEPAQGWIREHGVTSSSSRGTNPGGYRRTSSGVILPAADGSDELHELEPAELDAPAEYEAPPEPEATDAGVHAYRQQLARVRGEQVQTWGSGDDARDDDGDVWPVET